MTASVQTKKDRPNYYVVLAYKDITTGKGKTKWVSTDIPVKGNNKRLANERMKEVLAAHDTPGIDLSRDVLFLDYMEMWLEGLRSSIAPTTYDGYRLILDSHIKPFFKPLALKLKDMTPAHIQQYQNSKLKKPLSPNTVIKHLRNISKCLDSAVKQRVITFNPAKLINLPKKARYNGARFYNEREIERLLRCSQNDPLEIVILLTVFYGLRRSEALGLKWDAINDRDGTISIRHTVTQYKNKNVYRLDATKNDSSYATVPMPEFIKARLKKWKTQQARYRWIQPNDYVDEGYICTHEDGKLMLPAYVSQHFKRLLVNHDMPPIRFHDLRHSSAHYLKYLGFDLKDIQTWLRHKDIQTTMNIYLGNLDMEAKRDIAGRLNERFQNFSR